MTKKWIFYIFCFTIGLLVILCSIYSVAFVFSCTVWLYLGAVRCCRAWHETLKGNERRYCCKDMHVFVSTVLLRWWIKVKYCFVFILREHLIIDDHTRHGLCLYVILCMDDVMEWQLIVKLCCNHEARTTVNYFNYNLWLYTFV